MGISLCTGPMSNEELQTIILMMRGSPWQYYNRILTPGRMQSQLKYNLY